MEGRGSFCFTVFYLFVGLFSKEEPLRAGEKEGVAAED